MDAIPPTYPKTARMRQKGAFSRVLAVGDVFPGRMGLVRRAPNHGPGARLGLSTPRAYGNAVRRNRFRRLAREAFRSIRPQLGDFDYLVSPRRHLEEPTLEGLRDDLLWTLEARPVARRPRTKRPRRR